MRGVTHACTIRQWDHLRNQTDQLGTYLYGVSACMSRWLQSYNVRRVPGWLIQLPMANVLHTPYSYVCSVMLTA